MNAGAVCIIFLAPALRFTKPANVLTKARAYIHAQLKTRLSSIDLQTISHIRVDCRPCFERQWLSLIACKRLPMTLQFNQLLTDASINPADVRLLRHQTRLSGGKTPLDLFRAGRDAFDEYQSVQTHAQRANFRSPWWATFVGMHDGRTMFTGLYEVGEPRLLEQETHHPLAGITSARRVSMITMP